VIDGRLHPDDVAAIARQVAALLRDEPQAPRLLTAEQVADLFAVGQAGCASTPWNSVRCALVTAPVPVFASPPTRSPMR